MTTLRTTIAAAVLLLASPAYAFSDKDNIVCTFDSEGGAEVFAQGPPGVYHTMNGVEWRLSRPHGVPILTSEENPDWRVVLPRLDFAGDLSGAVLHHEGLPREGDRGWCWGY